MVTDKDLDRLAADRRIAAILAAANTPADRAELARERQAMSMFLEVRAATPAVVPGSAPPARKVGTHAPAGRFSGRFRFALVAGAAVLTAGGVAVAAPAGGIPGLGHHHAPGPSHGPNSGVVTSAPPAGTRTPTPGLTGVPGTAAPTGGLTAEQAMHGACQSWKSMQTAGKSVDFAKSPYDRLAATAGGPDKVPAFCAAVLGTPPGHSGHEGTPHPSAPRPSAPPEAHPSAQPEAQAPAHPGQQSTGQGTKPGTSRPAGGSK